MSTVNEIIQDENKINTVFGDDIEFKGRVVFKNSLKIKGTFEGQVESDGQLIIGQEAKVSAEIKAGVVSVYGELNGKIKASKTVELYKKSSTNGDIISPEVYIEKGSTFNGNCIMTPEE